MRVSVLVLDGVFDLGLAAVLDTLGTAGDLASGNGPRFTVRRVGVRRRVRTSQGLHVPVERAGSRDRPDVVVVPALGDKTPETLTGALARRDVADAGELIPATGPSMAR